MTTTLAADLTPAEYQARLDVLAEQSVRAAETHGVPSPQHDAAMDAYAEYEWEHALKPEALLISGDAVSKNAPNGPGRPAAPFAPTCTPMSISSARAHHEYLR